jgi:hypothetical protein
MTQKIDLSLTNSSLYESCIIEEVAGRLNLVTPLADAVNIVGRNIGKLQIDPEEVELTGAMAVWSYLVVFHMVVHKTRRVYYNDGRNPRMLIAAHG